MTCSHDNVKWFRIAQGRLAYFAALCPSCKQVGLLGHAPHRLTAGAPVQASAMVRWGQPVDGPPKDALYVLRQMNCAHVDAIPVEPVEIQGVLKRFVKCRTCYLIGAVRDDGSVSWSGTVPGAAP